MNETECMNHPGMPIAPTGAEHAPPLCEDCARSVELAAGDPAGATS